MSAGEESKELDGGTNIFHLKMGVGSCQKLSQSLPKKAIANTSVQLGMIICLSLSEKTAIPAPPFYVIAEAQQAHVGLSDRHELNSSAQDLDKERMKVFCQGTANTGHYMLYIYIYISF